MRKNEEDILSGNNGGCPEHVSYSRGDQKGLSQRTVIFTVTEDKPEAQEEGRNTWSPQN